MDVNGARIYLDESDVEPLVIEYLEEMSNHPAFDTENVKIMPDTHPEPNSRTLIGFTMPLNDIVIPNIVGNDIGCGVSGFNIGSELPIDPSEFSEFDTKVRNRIPMSAGRNGYSAPDRNYVNLKESFPWDLATERLARFVEQNNLTGTEIDRFEYDISYFKSLCKRVGYGMTDGINGVGTLGGGNHFIEISQAEKQGDYYIICHSGSRGMGRSVADYWQQKATQYRRANEIRSALPEKYYKYIKFDVETVPDHELITWVTGGKGSSFIKAEEIRDEFAETDPEQIETIMRQLKQAVPKDVSVDDPWDYLKGEEAYGYYRDLLFCQLYATRNRFEMIKQVAKLMNIDISFNELIDSPHNIVDYDDSMIRKGAARVRDGEKTIIPFNMRDGAILVEGKGNDEWNQSCPHGAGRTGSRRDAREQITEEKAHEMMADVYASEIPLDEAPHSYKDQTIIEDRIEETATVIDTLTPLINFKASS